MSMYKIATEKKYLGLAYLTDTNLFLSSTGYGRLKKHRKVTNLKNHPKDAKIFSVFTDDVWPLSHEKVANLTLVGLYEMVLPATDRLRPRKGEIIGYRDTDELYRIINVDLCNEGNEAFQLVTRKIPKL